MQENVNRAIRAWGLSLPDWVKVLAQKCDERQSQVQVARELDISSSAVNQVLGRAYGGRLERLETKVRGTYMQAVVACPVLGELSTRDCLDYQKKAREFRPTNPLRRALFVACPACAHREKPTSSGETRSGR